MDRISKTAQAIDVATESARGDMKTSREVSAGPIALGLEERQQSKQASGGLQHAEKDSIY